MATRERPPFATLLRRYRLVAGLTQEALAERAHLSAVTVGALERGVNQAPRRDTVDLLAEALGLSGQDRIAFTAAARRQDAPSAHPGFQPHRGDAPPPFVGRSRELALLERHLAGEGPPLLLWAGEPGIGKSRLLHEAAQRAGGAGLRMLHGGCQRRGGQEPFAPLLGAIKYHARSQAPTRLRADLQGCTWLVRLLPELAAGPIEPLPAWTLPPEQERRLVFEAVAHFLANVAGPAGTLLLLDDLQWAGGDALDLLATLMRLAAETPLRVVGAYRDTEVQADDPLGVTLADLAQAGLVTQRTLAPLTAPEAAQLLDGLLEGMDNADSPLREQVLARAEGVPFFVVSCAQALREGALQEGSAADGVPWDLAQGLRQRVAALPPAAREVLGMAAVAGRVAPRALLTQVAALPEREMLAALEAACDARLLEEAGPTAYRFAHDLIREVVEDVLSAGRRMLHHRDIARALAGMPGEPPVEDVAYHYAHTEEHAQAAHWLEWAGDRAAAEFANAAALAHYTAARERVLAGVAGGCGAVALSRLDEKLGDLRLLLGEYAQAEGDFVRAREAETEPARRAELWRKEGETWARRGEGTRAVAAFDAGEAEGDVRQGGELPARVRAALALSRADVHLRQHDYDATQAAAERALALLGTEPPGRATDLALARAHLLQGLVAVHRHDARHMEEHLRHSMAFAERSGDQTLLAAGWKYLGRLAQFRGNLAQAEESARRSLTAAERCGNQAAIGETLLLWTWLGYGCGDLARAEQGARRTLAIAERIGEPALSAAAWSDLGLVALSRGDLAQAEDYAQRGLVIFEQIGDQFGSVGSELRLGDAACERGELALAAAYFRRARRRARRIGDLRLQPIAAIGQARAHLRAGRVRHAAVLLEHARTLLMHQGYVWPVMDVQLAAAELQLCQRSLLAAQAAAEEALQLSTDAAHRPKEALARRLLGQCALARADSAEAEVHLRTALAMQVEMGAALEAARTRLLVAEALVAGAQAGYIPEESRTLLAEARAGFAACGAAGDLVRAEQVAAAWQLP